MLNIAVFISFTFLITCIGVVGAGISGCSVAYFLREAFADKLDLIVFEATDSIGL
jgi:protoporphyrinogen oxidase